MRHSALPFQVPMATLSEGSNQVELEGSPTEAGILPGEAVLGGMVTCEGDFYRVDQHVEVQAVVRAVVQLSCDLCTTPIAHDLAAPLRLFCERRGERDKRSEAESRDEDVGLLYHDGRNLDLRDEIRTVILLEVPWHPLCRPDCRGLCPRCGKNRNEGDCGCQRDHGPAIRDTLRQSLEAGSPAPDARHIKEE